MAQPFFWEWSGAVGLQHPFSLQVQWGLIHIPTPPPEFCFPGVCLQCYKYLQVVV